MSDWLELHRKPGTNTVTDTSNKIHMLSKFLPEPVKAHEFLTKFSQHMTADPQLLKEMEMIVKPDVSCKECAYTTVSTKYIEPYVCMYVYIEPCSI